MTAVVIRAATLRDLDDLTTLLVDFAAVHARHLPHRYQPVPTSTETTDYLRRVLALPQTQVFAAERAGQVVGMLILQRDHAPQTPVHRPRQWVTINVVVVRPAERRRGIGAALMAHAHAWAGAHGIDTVELVVAEGNAAALAWYATLGYPPQERRLAWSRDGERVAERDPTAAITQGVGRQPKDGVDEMGESPG